jgi:outer membrane receptor for ferrienterochelin and colicins
MMDVYQKERDEFGQMQRIAQQFAPKFMATYTVSYTVPKAGVTIDFTGRTSGPMSLPVLADREIDRRPDTSPWFSLVNVQLSKAFTSGFEIYGGCKNILNFIPKDPILFAEDPSSPYFDTTYNYAPIQGIKGFAGIRFTIQ